MVVQENTGRTSEKFVRSARIGLTSKLVSTGRFRLGDRGRQSMEDFGVKGISGVG